ncbi:MAG TPA: CDP-alcohol phosphatidyltransferase family protein, partial [Pirellulales bacterium]|nr:CDP-alcohol phosphatidyltransferase family protein [Pirellulales bacterium]
ALVCAVAAAAAFARGNVAGWLAGAALLQLWYLLDHVDGQLARLHRADTLDGMQLDYLMHHVVNLVIPWGVGLGLMQAAGATGWLIAGLAWSLGLLLLGLANDARYKAFIGRLKQLDGQLLVVAGGAKEPFLAGSPGPCARPLDGQAGHKGRDYGRAGHEGRDDLALLLKNALARIVHAARKFCEIHVVMNSLNAVAVAQLWTGNLSVGKWYLAIAAALALATAVATLARDIHRGAAEREFAQWYRAFDGV